jgi:hypothetical protein
METTKHIREYVVTVSGVYNNKVVSIPERRIHAYSFGEASDIANASFQQIFGVEHSITSSIYVNTYNNK